MLCYAHMPHIPGVFMTSQTQNASAHDRVFATFILLLMIFNKLDHKSTEKTHSDNLFSYATFCVCSNSICQPLAVRISDQMFSWGRDPFSTSDL